MEFFGCIGVGVRWDFDIDIEFINVMLGKLDLIFCCILLDIVGIGNGNLKF